jgi:hypothetical protein
LLRTHRTTGAAHVTRDLADLTGFAVEVVGSLFAERPGFREKGVEAGRLTVRVS